MGEVGQQAPAAPGARPIPVVELAVGLVLLVAATLVATLLEPVPAFERVVFEAVNGWPAAVSAALWPLMQLGSVVAGCLVGVVCLVVWRRPRPGLDVVVGALLASSLSQVVKALVERGRPADHLDDVVIRAHGVDGWGFVSGHTAIAFAVATALAPSLGRNGRIAVYVAASLIGMARMTHGVHLPADVVGGAGLGLLCGAAARLLFDRALPEQQPDRPDLRAS